jgi:hypothetical protein
MEAINRVTALLAGHGLDPWPIPQLAEFGRDAKRLWKETRQQFNLDVSFGQDAVALIDPDCRLPSDLEEQIAQKFSGVNRRVLISFIKWEVCAATSRHPNPYEPLVNIIEHAGYMHVEHGMFLDIYDFESNNCGVVLFQ